MWMARWGVFVEADTPEDAATAAMEKRNSDIGRQYWMVVNLDTGESFAVEATERQVIEAG